MTDTSPPLDEAAEKKTARILPRADGATIAYHRLDGRQPGIVFLGGFRSDMTGTKAGEMWDGSPLPFPDKEIKQGGREVYGANAYCCALAAINNTKAAASKDDIRWCFFQILLHGSQEKVERDFASRFIHK